MIVITIMGCLSRIAQSRLGLSGRTTAVITPSRELVLLKKVHERPHKAHGVGFNLCLAHEQVARFRTGARRALRAFAPARRHSFKEVLGEKTCALDSAGVATRLSHF